MASTNSWKCLLRPSVPTALSTGTAATRLAPFSTSAQACMVQKPKTGGGENRNERKKRTLTIKKKTVVKTGRPPAPGERKAMRKRIVLSNTNAIEVPGLKPLSAQTLADEKNVAQMVVLPGPVVDQLRTVEAFKTNQSWELFRTPSMLVREESVVLAKELMEAAEKKKTDIRVLSGAKGTGKSMLLLQQIAMAFSKGWIVVNIPEAQELTTAVTSYSPVPDTTPQQYSQNTYTAKLLSQIGKANNAILSKLVVSQDHHLPINLPSNTTLARLAELGARDPEVSWPIFQAFWAEITAPGRPPVLLAADGLNHMMKVSHYRSPEFELIHSFDLSLVKLFTEYLSGTKKFINGGAVLAATSMGNRPATYTMDAALQQALEKSQGVAEITQPNPWKEWDARVAAALEKAKIMDLKGLSRAEARGLMEYWASSGVLRQTVTEQVVAEKWTVAGHGVVGEIKRNVLEKHIAV